ncbi:MAG: hypothetical protein IPP99_12360 [Chitinophagaceae bacterium]|nr:hypothetical protein [Chitinophagaceae bacterium]
MPTQPTKPSTFLLFPWGLMSIVIILVLNLTLRDEWFSKNWSWIALVLIIPAAILENFKVNCSTMRIMFLKVVFSLLSFLLVGMAFGSALTQYYNKKFVTDGTMIKAINLPWYVLLALVVLLMIQVAQLFSMLKAVKREFMQWTPTSNYRCRMAAFGKGQVGREEIIFNSSPKELSLSKTSAPAGVFF